MARIRALALAVSLLIWQQVAAQDGENNLVIPTGQTTYEVTAGQPLTVEWTNPSSSTVTIKLQQEPPTPNGGIILTTDFPAFALTTTLMIPPAEDLNSSLYVLEIIDDIDPNNHNFSPTFSIDLETGSTSSATSETSATPTSTYDDSGPDTTVSETSQSPSTANQTDTSESDEASPMLSPAIIVTIVIGGIAVVFMIIMLAIYHQREYRKLKKMWATALNAVEETNTNGLQFTVETAQERFGRDREGSGQDNCQNHRSGLPVSYTVKGTMAPSSRELLSMMRSV